MKRWLILRKRVSAFTKRILWREWIEVAGFGTLTYGAYLAGGGVAAAFTGGASLLFLANWGGK